MREETLLWIFREVYHWPGSLCPRSLWKYFRTIRIRDICRLCEPHPIDLDEPITALPAMLSTTRLVLRLTISPPNDLFAAVAIMPNLRSLEFEEIRLDSFLPALKSFTNLDRLIMTVIPHIAEFPYSTEVDAYYEQANITTLLQTVSSRASYLEIAGDILSLSTLASIHWPNLRTLIISGHQPSEPQLPLATIINSMPKLVDLRLPFTAAKGHQVPPFLFCPGSEFTPTVPHLAAVAPQLNSLSLSNVLPEDDVFNQLPLSLTRLRILALNDATSLTADSIDSWYSYWPLTLPRSFGIIERISHLVDLIELALSITGTPTPDLMSAIGAACIRLRVLELEEDQYARVDVKSPSDLRSYVEPLQKLHHLRVLQITLRFLKTYNSLQLNWDPEDIRHAQAAQFFAERLSLLGIIAFSIRVSGVQ